jgi:hypothetical protein
MKKEITAVSAILAVAAGSAVANNLVQYQSGKVSDSRNILAMSDEMTCGKEMKEKVKECRRMMEEASCGAKMKECQKIMEKQKEGNCGSMMKSKEKAKEMSCGQCGAMK